MEETKLSQTAACGSDFWNDSCDPEQLKLAVEEGAVGATSNPSIVWNVIRTQKNKFVEQTKQLIKEHPSKTEDEIAWLLIKDMGKEAAGVLKPIFEATNGVKGKLSLQVSPEYFPSAEKMYDHAKELASVADNIAIKIPAVPAGIECMERLTAEGISVNATVSYSVAQALACAKAMENGLQKAAEAGLNVKTITPYVTIMVGRVDDHVKKVVDSQGLVLDPSALCWAGVAVFKEAHRLFKEKGLRPQLLAAAYRHHLHWSQLIGGNHILTMPHKWWNAFSKSHIDVKSSIDTPVEPSVIKELRRVPDFRVMFDAEAFPVNTFTAFGPSQYALQQFMIGLDDLRHFVRSVMIG